MRACVLKTDRFERQAEKLTENEKQTINEAVKETVQLMESKGLVIKKIKHLGNVN